MVQAEQRHDQVACSTGFLNMLNHISLLQSGGGVVEKSNQTKYKNFRPTTTFRAGLSLRLKQHDYCLLLTAGRLGLANSFFSSGFLAAFSGRCSGEPSDLEEAGGDECKPGQYFGTRGEDQGTCPTTWGL